MDEAEESLLAFDGVRLAPSTDFSTPIEGAATDSVFISRLRRHNNDRKALSFWCTADNLRKGAALNAIQIARRMCCNYGKNDILDT
jgi:aspartate-semialdehyde dehydrogenase